MGLFRSVNLALLALPDTPWLEMVWKRFVPAVNSDKQDGEPNVFGYYRIL